MYLFSSVLIVKDDVTSALSKVNKYVAKLSPDDQVWRPLWVILSGESYIFKRMIYPF